MEILIDRKTRALKVLKQSYMLLLWKITHGDDNSKWDDIKVGLKVLGEAYCLDKCGFLVRNLNFISNKRC